MRKENGLLKLFMIIAIVTNSSCALGMGRSRCDGPPQLPTRPEDEYCISNENGVGQCTNGSPASMKNYICRLPAVDSRNEEWIKDVLRIVNP